MRIMPYIVSTAIVGCSSTPDPAPATSPQTIRVTSAPTAMGSGASMMSTMRVDGTPVARVDTLRTTRDRAWNALPSIYAGLEIPISNLDPAQHTIGGSGFKTYRRLGKIPLTRIVDCGSTQIGPSADSYEVVLTILTKVQRLPTDSGATTVATLIEGAARPLQFKGDYVRCTTKGALEAQIAEVLKVNLAP